MLKNSKIKAALLLATSVVFFSCKSTPDAQPAPVEEPAASVEEENTAEEESAETNENVSMSQDDEIKKQNEIAFQKVEEARKEAIDANVDKLLSKNFDDTEAQYSEMKANLNGETKDYTAEINVLCEQYKALKDLANAKLTKERIDELHFYQYAEKKYEEGSSLIEELDSGSIPYGEQWNSKAGLASADMTNVLLSGFRTLAQIERVNAFNAKKDADSIKCSVSKKDEYTSCVELFKQGDSAYVTKNPEGAYNKYKESRDGFMNLFNTVSYARANALLALDEAKKRVSASEKVAVLADQEKPLGEGQIEGIETAGVKLLTDDDFSKNEYSIIQVDENLTDMDSPNGDLKDNGISKITTEETEVKN